MSDIRDAKYDQVAPTPNDGPSCHDLVINDLINSFNHDVRTFSSETATRVIDDLTARKQMGLEKYNSLLQPNNGRSMLLDAYEEAMDLSVYLRGALYEAEEAGRPLSVLSYRLGSTLNLLLDLNDLLEEERSRDGS